MHSSSIVLFKDFLKKNNSISQKQPVNNNRLNTKHLIRQLQRNKLPTRQSNKTLLPTGNTNRIQGKHRSQPVIEARSNQHKKEQKILVIRQKPQTSQNKRQEKKVDVVKEFTDSKFKKHHQTMPTINPEKISVTKILNKPKEHHFPSKINYHISTDRKEITTLNINLAFLKNTQKTRLKQRSSRCTSEGFRGKIERQSLSNLLTPEELKMILKPGQSDMRLKIQKKIQQRNQRNKSFTQKIAQIFAQELTNQHRLDFDYNDTPQELSSSKIVFYQKKDPRKQFLVNVRKIKCLQKQCPATQRNYNQQPPTSPMRRHLTPHLKRNYFIPPTRNNSTTRFNTFKDNHAQKQSIQDMQIEPW